MSYDLNTQYMTIVLALPQDSAQRAKVVQKFGIDNQVDGARVTAVSIGDCITELERREEVEGLH
ncbi:hypothetical protein [Dyella ginsengisoli]|uniref:hypothetical protein n=1 Tax=Dyella ginsengisoli TaxID=363848 RepID=UPI000345CACA|nr:hypothetical protein [Dyella ginsengisoli]